MSKEDKEAACEGKKSEKGETEEAPSHRSSKKETCGQKAFIKKLALEKKLNQRRKIARTLFGPLIENDSRIFSSSSSRKS